MIVGIASVVSLPCSKAGSFQAKNMIARFKRGGEFLSDLIVNPISSAGLENPAYSVYFAAFMDRRDFLPDLVGDPALVCSLCGCY